MIPTLNEARNLPLVLPNIPSDVFEVILVDGASTDGTIAVAQSLLPSIKIVIEPRAGKGAALCAGFRAVEGDIIVMLDADGSTDPNEIPRFVDALVRGADFAKGSRFLGGGGSSDITRLRAFGNWGFVTLVRLLFGGRYTDLCYGYNAFWVSALPILALDGVGFEIETMMNVRALREGLHVAEVPSFERSRIHGQSNLRTFRDGWRILRTIFREWTSPRRALSPSVDMDRDVALATESSGPPSLHLVPVMDLALEEQLAFTLDAPRDVPAGSLHLVPVMEPVRASDLAARAAGTPHSVAVIDMLRASLEHSIEGLSSTLMEEDVPVASVAGGES